MNTNRYDKVVYFLETVHIPLWLIKDLCWLLTYRTLGVAVAVPTILVAIMMAVITRRDKNRFLPNVSIAFWIIANTNWMFAEFFEADFIRFYSLYPFLAGIGCFAVFVYRRQVNAPKNNQN